VQPGVADVVVLTGAAPVDRALADTALRCPLAGLVEFLTVPGGALVKPKDPLEYVRKLRFQQGVSSLRDYGVTPAGCAA